MRLRDSIYPSVPISETTDPKTGVRTIFLGIKDGLEEYEVVRPERKREKIPNAHREAAKWLLSFFNEWDHGLKVLEKNGKSKPIHVNKKTILESVSRSLSTGDKPDHWITKQSQRNLFNHFSGKQTRYYTSKSSGPILINLDLDNHDKGSIEGGKAFFEHLKSRFSIFMNLYFETSTNGNGLHGYVIVEPDEDLTMTVQQKNQMLKRLQERLRDEATGFDIGDIEIKGTIPVCTWRSGEPTWTCGQLAKIPREVSRFEEWKDTARFNWSDVSNFVRSIHQSDERSVQQVHSVPIKRMTSVLPIPNSYIDAIPKFQGIVDEMLWNVPEEFLRTRHGRAVITEDIQIGIAVVLWATQIKQKRNEDHMPHNFIQSIWTRLHQQGLIQRAFNNSRWKLVRTILTASEWIDWTSHEYQFFQTADEAGNKIQGTSCRWIMNEEKVELCISLIEEEREIYSVSAEEIFEEWTPIDQVQQPIAWFRMDQIAERLPDMREMTSILKSFAVSA